MTPTGPMRPAPWTCDTYGVIGVQFLLSKDQLIRQKQQNQIFTDFQEAEINFWPTYRRVKGTDLYSNKKNQSPSWCDRVLIKSERNIDILYYDSIQEVNLR